MSSILVLRKNMRMLFEWYQERSTVAADNLIIEVEEAIRSICEDPSRYRKTYRDLHEWTLKKYPFCLIYLIDEVKKIVTILSIFHHKRNPVDKYRK
ncbi:MAG TPA: type II toxin-antitoxin system RelE/ParE family toxin [Segetibacter sp.]